MTRLCDIEFSFPVSLVREWLSPKQTCQSWVVKVSHSIAGSDFLPENSARAAVSRDTDTGREHMEQGSFSCSDANTRSISCATSCGKENVETNSTIPPQSPHYRCQEREELVAADQPYSLSESVSHVSSSRSEEPNTGYPKDVSVLHCSPTNQHTELAEALLETAVMTSQQMCGTGRRLLLKLRSETGIQVTGGQLHAAVVDVNIAGSTSSCKTDQEKEARTVPGEEGGSVGSTGSPGTCTTDNSPATCTTDNSPATCTTNNSLATEARTELEQEGRPARNSAVASTRDALSAVVSLSGSEVGSQMVMAPSPLIPNQPSPDTPKRKRGRPRKTVLAGHSTQAGRRHFNVATTAENKTETLPKSKTSLSTADIARPERRRYSLRGKKLPPSFFGDSDSEAGEEEVQGCHKTASISPGLTVAVSPGLTTSVSPNLTAAVSPGLTSVSPGLTTSVSASLAAAESSGLAAAEVMVETYPAMLVSASPVAAVAAPEHGCNSAIMTVSIQNKDCHSGQSVVKRSDGGNSYVPSLFHRIPSHRTSLRAVLPSNDDEAGNLPVNLDTEVVKVGVSTGNTSLSELLPPPSLAQGRLRRSVTRCRKRDEDPSFSPSPPPSLTRRKRRRKTALDMTGLPTFARRKRNNKKQAACKYCQRQFCDYTGVSMHVRKFHQDEKDLAEYVQSLKKLEMVKCSVCSLWCQSRFHLQQHEDKEHFKAGSFACTQCHKMWPNMMRLKAHIRTVHLVQGKAHACPHCPSKFKWAATLKQHVKEIHEGLKGVACDVCGKQFYRRSQLNRHSIIHKPEEYKLECKVCGRKFGFLNNLQRHVSIVHRDSQRDTFHCSYCGKGFTRKAALISHIEKGHFSMFPHVCDICKSGFARAASFEKHMAVEHDLKDFKAPEGRRSHFKYHRTMDDVYSCNFCGDHFYYKAQLVEHIHNTHGKTFPFQCPACQQGFLDRRFLDVHCQQAHGMTDLSNGTVPGMVVMVTEAGDLQNESCSTVMIAEQQGMTATTMDTTATSTATTINSVSQEMQQSLVVMSASTEGEESVLAVSNRDSAVDESTSYIIKVEDGENTVQYILQPRNDGSFNVSPDACGTGADYYGDSSAVHDIASLLLAADQSVPGGVMEAAASGQQNIIIESDCHQTGTLDAVEEGVSEDVVIATSTERFVQEEHEASTLADAGHHRVHAASRSQLFKQECREDSSLPDVKFQSDWPS